MPAAHTKRIRPSNEHAEIVLAATDGLGTVGYHTIPGMAECDRALSAHDAFLVKEFASTTSLDLLGDPKLWARDAMQLAFQV